MVKLEDSGSVSISDDDVVNWSLEMNFEYVSPGDPERLVYVDSIHEQREFNNKIMPALGYWIEVGDFEPVIESWNLRERWECVALDAVDDDSKLVVKLKRLDHVAMKKECDPLVEEIISRHKRKLLDSLRIAIVRGLYYKSGDVDSYIIDRAKARINNYGDSKAQHVALESVDRRHALQSAEEKLARQQSLVDEIRKELEEE